MVSHFQFLEPVGDGEFSPTHTLFVYEGPDWCLHELQDSAGSAIRCWSYEILGLEQLEGGSLVREIVLKPRDWVGSCLLRTYQVPCRLEKENEKGIWLKTASWSLLQWPSKDRAAADAWRSATAGNTSLSRARDRSAWSGAVESAAVCRIRLR